MHGRVFDTHPLISVVSHTAVHTAHAARRHCAQQNGRAHLEQVDVGHHEGREQLVRDQAEPLRPCTHGGADGSDAAARQCGTGEGNTQRE